MNEYEDVNEVKIMHCGHPASGQDDEGDPICKACAHLGIKGHDRVNDGLSLKGREAVCRFCGLTQESSTDLDAFKYRKDMHMDNYTCNDCRLAAAIMD